MNKNASMGFRVRGYLKRNTEEIRKIINLKGFNKIEQQALLAALARKGKTVISEYGTLFSEEDFSVFVTILTKNGVISGKYAIPPCNVIVTFDNNSFFNALDEGDYSILQEKAADDTTIYQVSDIYKQEIFPIAGGKCVTRIGRVIDPMVIMGVPELADMVSPTTDVSRMWRVIENASTLECLFGKVWKLIQYIVEQCQELQKAPHED